MCNFVIAAFMIGSAVAMAAEQLPTFPRGTLYEEARNSLIAMGYRPVRQQPDQVSCAIGRTDICGRHPETLSCSGTGQVVFCSFLWRRGTGTVIEISTYGGENLRVDQVRCRSGCR